MLPVGMDKVFYCGVMILLKSRKKIPYWDTSISSLTQKYDSSGDLSNYATDEAIHVRQCYEKGTYTLEKREQTKPNI